jgi:hypothetical protein
MVKVRQMRFQSKTKVQNEASQTDQTRIRRRCVVAAVRTVLLQNKTEILS